MAVPLRQLEVDRVMNMARAFGWDLVKQEFDVDVTKIALSFPIAQLTKQEAEMEMQRMLNVARTLGWEELTREFQATQMLLVLQKPAPAAEAAGLEIPT